MGQYFHVYPGIWGGDDHHSPARLDVFSHGNFRYWIFRKETDGVAKAIKEREPIPIELFIRASSISCLVTQDAKGNPSFLHSS